MRKRICILVFSNIYLDARPQRQIKYLSKTYDITVVAYGPPCKDWEDIENLEYVRLPEASKPWIGLIKKNLRLVLSTLNPLLVPGFREALQIRCDACLANDWKTLPLAAEICKRNRNAPLVFDAHEYAPLEGADLGFKLFFAPQNRYVLRKFVHRVDAMVTVARAFAERYEKEFGFRDVGVILNAPEVVELPVKEIDADHIRLVHHGVAVTQRRLEVMIQTLALCDERYSLHLMLVNNESKVARELQQLAQELVPGRVEFHPAVLPHQIVETISQYDVGFDYIAPTHYSHYATIPNKFFDFIVAGLAVINGPSPSCAEIVRQYGLGVVTPSFEAEDIARVLNETTAEQWTEMRAAARKATAVLNASVELNKLVRIFDHLLDS